MARPAKLDIDNGIQNWDGKMDTNDEVILNAPFPMHVHTGDQTDLEAAFAAAAYDRCHVMVNHTTLGWSLYVSDGTTWLRMLSIDNRPTVVALTTPAGTGNDACVAVPVVNGSGATTAQEAAINDNFADVVDKIEEIRAALAAHGLIT